MPAESLSRKPVSFIERLSQRKHRQAEHGDIILGRRRIYILPTRYGLTFTLLLLVMLFGSINYNNNLGYAFTFLFGSITTLSMLFTHRNLLGLKLGIARPRPVFAGQPVRIHCYISGGKRFRFSVQLHAGNSDNPVDDIVTGSTTRYELVISTTSRGLHRVPRIKCFSEYPYGLFHAWSWLTPAETVLVYPAPEATAPPVRMSGHGEGIQLPHQQAGAEDFFGLRNYRRGDPKSHIAWKQQARTGSLAVKQFSDTRGNTVYLDWYQLVGMDNEARLSRLTRWVLDAADSKLNYGLVLPEQTIEPGNTEAHMHECLKALALFGYTESN